MVKIFGRVTDFEGQPIKGVMVFLKDTRFEDVATAKSDEDGRYSLIAPKGRYMALAAVKHYMIKFLEYWAWNIPANQDLEINPSIDRMEVYAINAWTPQGRGLFFHSPARLYELASAEERVTLKAKAGRS